MAQKIVDTSSFTKEQQILFNRAAGLAPEETRVTSTGQIAAEKAARQNTSSKATGSTPTPGPTSNAKDPFLEELQKRLLEQSDLISSSQSGLEAKITSAITGITESKEASAFRTESIFERERGELVKARSELREIGEASVRGTGSQTMIARLAKFDENTSKQLKDLAQRKSEALALGDAAAAAKISELEVSTLEFQIQAQQQVFSNLISQAGLGIQVKAEQRAASQFKANLDFQKTQFNFTKASTLATLAAEFGIELADGETLETLSAKIAPIATKKRNAEIARLLKDINEQQFDIDFQSRLADIIVENPGISPSQAAVTVLNEMSQLLGRGMTEAEINKANNLAQLLVDAATAETERVSAEEAAGARGTVSGIFEAFFGGTGDRQPLIGGTGISSGGTPSGAFAPAPREKFKPITLEPTKEEEDPFVRFTQSFLSS